MRPLPPLSDAGHQAITTELVRLSLPHPHHTDRPELVHPLDEEALTDQIRRTRRRSRR